MRIIVLDLDLAALTNGILRNVVKVQVLIPTSYLVQQAIHQKILQSKNDKRMVSKSPTRSSLAVYGPKDEEGAPAIFA